MLVPRPTDLILGSSRLCVVGCSFSLERNFRSLEPSLIDLKLGFLTGLTCFERYGLFAGLIWFIFKLRFGFLGMCFGIFRKRFGESEIERTGL